MDSNGDGIGQFNGLISKLDYLQKLGFDGIWLSPFYPSPMKDFGYNVSDYCDIDPVSGDLAIFDTLVRELHARNLKLLIDWVPNHTSDQHPWFIELRSSRDNPKRDWYLWHDANQMAASRITGRARSADHPGNGTRTPINIICTRFCPNNPT